MNIKKERRQEEMNLKGIIFDFNGTMYIDGLKQETAWFEFFKRHAEGKYTMDQLHQMIHGVNGGELLKMALNPELTEDEVDRLTEEKEDIYREMCLNDPKGMSFTEGLTDFLAELKKMNVPCAIATASAIGNVRFYIKHMHLDRWIPIENIVYDDGSFLGKPEPDIYLKAMRRIGLKPEQCVVFEDADAGIEAARRAGAGKIIAIGPKADHKRLSCLPGVTAVIEDFREIGLDILKE